MVDYDAARSNLPYLDAVLLETMRVLPPAYMVGRCAKDDVNLGGYDIPKGTTILIGCVIMHRCRLRGSPLVAVITHTRFWL